MIDGMRVIDFHGHVGQNEQTGWKDDPVLMMRVMDSVGIDVACLFHIFYPDGTRSNDLTARFVANNPERFVGFAYVSPIMPERVIPELKRAIDELNFVAIKLYPPYTPWNDFSQFQWDPVYQFANERELAVVIHTDDDYPPRHMADIAPRYPRAKFIVAHSGNTPPARAQAIAAARANPNVYLETCSSFRTPGVIEQLVNEGGADRVLFGSDIPLLDPRCQIGKIITARISEEDKRKILGGNARRLLGI